MTDNNDLKKIEVNSLDDVLLREETQKFLGIQRSKLDDLRQKGLPFCRVSTRNRLYLVQDVLDFVVSTRMTL